MMYKVEVSGAFFDSITFRENTSMHLDRFSLRLAELLGLDDSRMYVDVVLKNDNGYNGEAEGVIRYVITSSGARFPGVEHIDASAVKLGNVLENIGDKMVLHAGYDEISIRLRGIVFE